MTTGPRALARERGAQGAFTLIEMLAVVAIFALLAGLVVPGFSSMSGRVLRNEAGTMAAQLELARQRSVVTGIPHRLRVDLDAASYRLEWLVSESQARGEDPPPARPVYDTRGDAPLPLSAPRGEEMAFRPLPGVLGRERVLDDDVAFAGLETSVGWTDRGETYVDFGRDGTASWATIVLESADGPSLSLEILPLDEAVRIGDAEL